MDIRKIVVAGAGTMGSSMAQIFARYHYNVTLYNHRQATLDKAKERITENVQTLTAGKELSQEEASALLSSLSYTTDLDCFKDCDLVVENLAEVLDIKSAFYSQISELVRPETIIATNTSGLSINKLALPSRNRNAF